MCVDLSATTIVPNENDFQYVNNNNDLGRALRQDADCVTRHDPGFGRMPDNVANRITGCVNRLRLICLIQTCAAMAYVLALADIIAAYFDERTISSTLFLNAIMLLMISMLLFIRDIPITNTSLDVYLSDLEEHQEWQQYLQPKRLGCQKN